MRASPYDLTDLGYPPVRIETVAGKAEYVAAQRDFAAKAQILRRRLSTSSPRCCRDEVTQRSTFGARQQCSRNNAPPTMITAPTSPMTPVMPSD